MGCNLCKSDFFCGHAHVDLTNKWQWHCTSTALQWPHMNVIRSQITGHLTVCLTAYADPHHRNIKIRITGCLCRNGQIMNKWQQFHSPPLSFGKGGGAKTLFTSIHVWLVSIQLDDTEIAQKWTWFQCSKRKFCKVRHYRSLVISKLHFREMKIAICY